MLSKTKAAYIVCSIILEAQIIRQKLELQGNRIEDDELNDFLIEIYHCLADYNRTHHEPLSFERDWEFELGYEFNSRANTNSHRVRV